MRFAPSSSASTEKKVRENFWKRTLRCWICALPGHERQRTLWPKGRQRDGQETASFVPRRSRLLRKGSAAGQCEARSEDGETWIVSFCLSSLLRLSSFPLFRLSLSFCFLSFTVFFSCLSSFIVFPSFCLTSVFFSLLFRLSLSCSLFMSVVFSLKVEHSVGTCYFYSNTIFSMIVCFDCE